MVDDQLVGAIDVGGWDLYGEWDHLAFVKNNRVCGYVTSGHVEVGFGRFYLGSDCGRIRHDGRGVDNLVHSCVWDADGIFPCWLI